VSRREYAADKVASWQQDNSNTGKTSHKYPVNYHNRLYMQMQHKSGAALEKKRKKTYAVNSLPTST